MDEPWPPQTSGEPKIDTWDPHHTEPQLARRVRWIPFDSGFRGAPNAPGTSILRVGDLIVGHNGERYTQEHVDDRRRIGELYLQRWLDGAGLYAGDSMTLLVLRDQATVAIEGTLQGNRRYRNEEGHTLLGPGGPSQHDKDGFRLPWGRWYRDLEEIGKIVLAGWDYTTSYVTAKLRERVLPFGDRVAFLEANYPGPAATAARHDYDAMLAMVTGEQRTLPPEALEYRNLGEQRARAVTEAADRAFEAFLDEVDLIEDPPDAPNPFNEDLRALIGKPIRLPELGTRDLRTETTRTWYHAGGHGGGYLVDRSAPGLDGLYRATDEYMEKVDPFLRDRRTTFVGVIEPEPALVVDVDRNITVAGLKVRPLAAVTSNAKEDGRRFFVDLRPSEIPRDEAFAGEAALLTGVHRPTLTDGSSPSDVFLASIHALKVADMDTWLSLYAGWKVRTYHERDRSFSWVDRGWTTMSEQDAGVWDTARKRLLDDVYGVEVAHVGPIERVYDVEEQPADMVDPEPRIVERVRLRIDHIGLVDGEYRTFAGFMLHRLRELQRLDDGPWRIADSHGL